MNDNKVKTVDVDGVKVAISVNSEGLFAAQIDQEWLQKPTLKELE